MSASVKLFSPDSRVAISFTTGNQGGFQKLLGRLFVVFNAAHEVEFGLVGQFDHGVGARLQRGHGPGQLVHVGHVQALGGQDRSDLFGQRGRVAVLYIMGVEPEAAFSGSNTPADRPTPARLNFSIISDRAEYLLIAMRPAQADQVVH